MKNVYVSPAVFDLFPDYAMATMVARGIDNHGEHPELLQKLEALEDELRSQPGWPRDVATHPRLASWRSAFGKFGVDAAQKAPSVQALVEAVRSGRNLGYHNTIVAISNYISLKYLMPSGADDMDKTVGNLGVRPAKGNEVYVAFDSNDVDYPQPGEIIYADDEKVMCRAWVWRQGVHTVIDPDSRNVTINLDVLPPATPAEAQAALEEMAELVRRFCGGEVFTNIVTREQPVQPLPPPLDPRQPAENVYDVLELRGYVQRTSDRAAVRDHLGRSVTIYQGFDPTAPSLHVAHLMSLMVFSHLQNAGHRMIFILGAGTAQVGDPSGRETTRPILTVDALRENARAIQEQVQRVGLVDFESTAPGKPAALMLDNSEWLNMPVLQYAREVTRHFSVNEMVKRDTFRRRLEKEEPLSLLEFLYASLQGYDFEHLYEQYDCVLQMGGNDQWANILSGMDLIRRKLGGKAYAMVFPLLMDRSGQKMGKTAAGEKIWLASEGPCSTSPFEFYQYWVNCPDEDVERNLKLFTFLPLAEIREVLQGHPRDAQHRLAYEVTRIMHGEQVADQIRRDVQQVFGPAGGAVSQVPSHEVTSAELERGLTLRQALLDAEATRSLGEGKRLIEQGGVRLNEARVGQFNYALRREDFVEQLAPSEMGGPERVAIVRYGKGKVLKLTLVP
jgi:tyrosyl-tRNA synthetase